LTGNVVVPNNTSLAFGDTVTFEAWVRLLSLPPATAAGANLITKNTGSLVIRIYPSGELAMRKSGGAEIARSTTALAVDGRFHHVVGTKSAGAVHLYIDGADVTGSVANQTLTNNTAQLVIGHNPVSSNDGLDGFIDEVALYKRALSATEVARNYNIGTQPDCREIPGATGTSYVPNSADLGLAILVKVTATNDAGSSTASSPATGVVAPPQSTTPPVGWASYKDQPIGNAGAAPTASKPESKLWWNDGTWWSVMWSGTTGSAGFHIFRLSADHTTWVDTGIPVDDRPGTRADALWDGSHLYVASHVFSTCGCSTSSAGKPARVYRYSYNPILRTYSLDAGFPVAINDTASETLVIDKDSRGTLWATWAQDGVVKLAHTSGSDAVWTAPFTLPAAGATGLKSDDISSVVAFGTDKVGVMWSSQTDSAMYFSVHVDGASDSAWSSSRNAVSGPNFADDHINLKSLQADPSGRVFAAVKTSLDDLPQPNPNAPLIMLVARDPATGDWSNSVFGRVGDHHTRPILLLDAEHQVIHMFATAPTSGGAIYEKTSPLSSISFTSGLGTRILADPDSQDMSNVTSTKQNVNSTTGLLVMASNDTTQANSTYPSPTGGYYWHAYEPLSP
jgi:hypothetical protein